MVLGLRPPESLLLGWLSLIQYKADHSWAIVRLNRIVIIKCPLNDFVATSFVTNLVRTLGLVRHYS